MYTKAEVLHTKQASAGYTDLFQVTCTRGLTHHDNCVVSRDFFELTLPQKTCGTQIHHNLVMRTVLFAKEDSKPNL